MYTSCKKYEKNPIEIPVCFFHNIGPNFSILSDVFCRKSVISSAKTAVLHFVFFDIFVLVHTVQVILGFVLLES